MQVYFYLINDKNDALLELLTIIRLIDLLIISTLTYHKSSEQTDFLIIISGFGVCRLGSAF